ncbi:MAG: hypothetical protein ACE5I3_12050 [Phycisphaerae bacterium]
MFEVYTGVKAGRPTVLLLLTAGVLVATLALAWTQVRGTRALGDEVRIKGTPLTVRPPKGWVQSSTDPGVFGKPVRKRVWGREVWAAERKLEFHYNDYFVQFTRLFQAAAANVSRPAQIGGWDGVQFLLERRGSRSGDQTIYRAVSTPWGGQISVEYTPLAEVSHGDLELLDVVCEAVQLSGSNLRSDPQETLAYAGVRFPIAPGWEVLGPQDGRGPGLWMQRVEADRPVWALAVFRRYLRRGSQPIDLLLAESRQLLPRLSRPQEARRDDGTYLAVTHNRDLARTGSVVVSVWVVAKSRVEVAVIYVLADPRYARTADDAAVELAGTIEFVSEFPR